MYLGGLCFITDCKASKLSYDDMTLRVLRSGVKWVQYREKGKSRQEVYEEADRLRKLTQDFNAVLIVNDYADIAMCVNAVGVHLGQEDLPLREARKIMGKNRIVGISTHSLEQAIEAEKGGADYIGFGPVFHTTTKNAGNPKGVRMLREVKKQVTIPLVAIGGINLENIQLVLDAGADAVAVASAILSGEIEGNINRFMQIIRFFDIHYPQHR